MFKVLISNNDGTINDAYYRDTLLEAEKIAKKEVVDGINNKTTGDIISENKLVKKFKNINDRAVELK